MLVSKKITEISYLVGMDFSPIFSNIIVDYRVEFKNGTKA